MHLDELDKKVMHEICSGINSYDDLATTLKVTRGTIYRRMEKLEKIHAITKKIMAIPDYRNLNLSAIFIGMDAVYDDMDKIIDAIRTVCNVKWLWRAYGTHQVIAILICEKGCEGATIADLHRILSKFSTDKYHVSIGYEWEKVEISPY